MDEDPIFYMKFSEIIEATIKAFQENRLSETDYLEEVLKIRNENKRDSNSLPGDLQNNPKARAFYGAINEVINKRHEKPTIDAEKLARVSEDLDRILEDIATVDWKTNPNKPLEIANRVEDHLLSKRKDIGVDLSFDDIDEIIKYVLKIAKSNY